ncbi:MAG: U32 family peptidase [Betaproteobacteria bacterium]|nr:U32 family peptidase [Betaproteobacteria bacterium]
MTTTNGLPPTGKSARIELVCPAGNLPSLRAAVDNGADSVYIGLRDNTNARNFGGLNFELPAARDGLDYAHRSGTKVLLAINTYPQPATWQRWTRAVDTAAGLGFDAVIIADAGLMRYAVRTHPQLRIHLSVQGSATSYEAINFYHRHFNVRRAVLPRVLSLAQVEQVIRNTPVEIEVFGFGSLCVMVEGRCALSSYVTGESPNMTGACSPAKAVRWEQKASGLEARLNGVLIDRYGANENAAYPTLCKGRFKAGDDVYYAIEEPASLNALELLPELDRIGVAAVKIEGRQRSPAYVAAVTRVWRQALDACAQGTAAPQPRWSEELRRMSEGQSHTLGAYHRPWK